MLGAAWTGGCDAPLDVAALAVTHEVFANPERGFYLPADTHSDRYRPLDPAVLGRARRERQISLVYRGFILDDFVAAPISGAYLRAMEADFANLREAGAKAIVRFAYTTHVRTAPGSDWPPVQPYGDAPPAQVRRHLDQLQPLLRAHADVIAVVQAGFVGIWGEWFYTDHYAGDDLDAPGPDHWEARRQVMTRLLQALPPDLPVQVRTPLHKRRLTGQDRSLSAAAAFQPTAVARLGHHNDCFLASDTDYGTYRDTTADFGYLQADSRFVPVGGETCARNPPRSGCASALRELARFHWSYLNSGYHRGVLADWDSAGCLDEVRRRLGYRLRLTEAAVSARVRRAGACRVRLGLVNDGFAAPFRRRNVAVVLRQRGSGRGFGGHLDVDLRRLLPGDTLAVDTRLGLPEEMPPGAYDVFLRLPDPDPRLATRPGYAVRLANDGVWQPSSGDNALGLAVTVTADRAWWPVFAPVQLTVLPPDP